MKRKDKLCDLGKLVVTIFGLVLCLVQFHSTTAADPTTTPAATTTTLSPQKLCASLNKSCEQCVSRAECLWCGTHKTCKPYPVGHIIPRASDCDLGDARWGVCWVNFKALIITMSVIAGVLLISTCCCIYCCCCRSKGNKLKYQKEEARMERERDERRQRSDERKEERKARADEIRRKYGIEFKGPAGLIKDDNPYQRFDA